MRVCLVYPANFFKRRTDSIPFNQQLFYLYSYLRQHAPEVEVEILDLRWEISSPEIIDVPGFLREAEILLRRSGFDLVGISCWTTYNYPSSVEIAKLCKRLNPECTVVVGGWHPTFVPEDFTYPGSPFDYVVKGEGEQALLDIVQGRIPREQPTVVVQGTPLGMGEHALAWGECKYHRALDAMPVWLSRGCPFACTFCADRLSTYRLLSPRECLAEIRRILAAHPQVSYIKFYDPLFGIRREWRHELLALLKEADLPVGYWAETRVDLLDESDLDLVAGLTFRLDMGLESVVPELLAIMKKTTDPEKYIRRCFELDTYMNRRRIPHVYNHMYNHPGETPRTLRQSLAFWDDYFQRVAPGHCYTHLAAGTFMFLPGSDVYFNWDDYAAKYGCTIADRGWWRQTEYPLEGRSQYIVGSRELAEAGDMDLAVQASLRLTRLSLTHMDVDAFKTHTYHRSWENSFLMLRSSQGLRYFEDKPLGLHPRAAAYPLADGAALLLNFASGQNRPLSPAGAAQIHSLLAGRTVADVYAQAPPDAHAQNQLRRFVSDLLENEFLALHYPPPADAVDAGTAGRPRVALATSAGELEIELDAAAAPLLAANFLHLAGGSFYDGLFFDTERPSAYLEIGVTRDCSAADGPGYTLPATATGLPAGRGALGMVLEGARLHGSRLRFYRQAPEPGEPSFVFGRVVAGLDVLDRLMPHEYLVAARLPGTPAEVHAS